MKIKPQRIFFTNLKKSEKATTDISITVNEPDKIKISSMKLGNPSFDIKQKDGTPEKGGLYEITFNGSDKLGTVSATLVIELEGTTKPYVEVLVSALVFGNLSYPRKIYFHKTADGYSIKNLAIATKNGVNLTVSKIEDLDKLLKVEIEKNGAPRVNIKATVADQKKKHDENFSHKLILHTDDKDQPTIEIDYRIVNRELRPMARGVRQLNTKGKSAPVIPTKAPASKK